MLTLILLLVFFSLNLFLAVISDSFDEVNQNEQQAERKKQELMSRIEDQISYLKTKNIGGGEQTDPEDLLKRKDKKIVPL